MRVPLRFADGFHTTGDIFTFDGLIDGKEHLAIALGDWRHARNAPPPLVRLYLSAKGAYSAHTISLPPVATVRPRQAST